MNRVEQPVDCTWICDRLESYLDQEVDAAVRVRVEAHLDQCPDCCAELALARRIGSTLQTLPLLAAPAALIDQVVERTEGRTLPFWRRRTLWVAAATLVLAIGATLFPWATDAPQYSPAQIARAQQQAKWTLAYIGQLGHRTGLTVRDQVLKDRLIEPIERRVKSALNTESM